LKTNISAKNINRLAIPALIAGIAEPLLSITDTAIIGNIDVNPIESLGAVGIVGTFLSMLVWVFGQSRSAISSIVSQYLGANKLDEIKTLPAQAIVIIVSASLLILGLTFPFAREIFGLYGAENIILDYAVDYFEIRIFGLPFSLFVFAVFGTFRGLQNTYHPMIIAIIGAIINVILDVILVYGIEGIIPAMNIKGAAYASVIAQISMAVLAAIYLLKKTSISLKVVLPFNLEIKSFINMILHLFVRTIALNTALIMAVYFATSYGKEALAAYTISINIWFLCAFIIDGYASAGNVLSGKLLGGKEYSSLLILSSRLTKYALFTSISVALIGFIFYNFIGEIFTDEQVVLDEFYSVFWIVLIQQPLCAITFVFDGFFKGMGKMKYLRNVLLLTTGLVFIPSLLLFDYLGLNLHAIWITFALWVIARGLPLVIEFRSKFSALAEEVK
jgi:MATE family multidrug resistance protein